MTKQSETTSAPHDTHTVTLDTPIIRGETEIRIITLRRPKAGELRGLTISDLARLDVTALLKLLPRITTPSLTPPELEQLQPEDLFDLATQAGSFLLKKSELAALPTG